MKYLELKANLPKEIADEFNDFLDSIQPEGYYEILFDSSLPKNREVGILREDTNIHIYLSSGDIEKEIKIRIFLKSKVPENHFLESREVETREFEEAYKEFYKPFKVSKSMWIVPVWERESDIAKSIISANEKILFLNPGLAFGTGHHETTKLMLERLEEVMEPGSKIIDCGTGSGILSVGAALLGASSILAFDVDPNSVKATNHNWEENYFTQPKIKILEGGFDLSEIFESEFDLALANITFAVISSNIDRIKKINTKRFLFSGLISEKREASISLFKEKIGGELVYEKEWNEWLVIDWKR